MEKVPNATSTQFILLTSFYVLTLVALAIVIFTIAPNASIIWQTEANVGHPLTCDEAYNRREIDAYFYPERRTQGDTLYMYSLCSPIILVGFILLTVVMGTMLPNYAPMVRKRLYALLGLGSVILIALLIYSPTIYIIGCALE